MANYKKVKKTAYICGPIRELDTLTRKQVMRFYQRIADVFKEVTGLDAFVPHKRFDPENYVDTPKEIDRVERYQVCNRTSLLIVAAVAPSWGGGIEVEMANQNNVPVVILCEREKLKNRKLSRLLMGNHAIEKIIEYDTEDEAVHKLMEWLGFLDFT